MYAIAFTTFKTHPVSFCRTMPPLSPVCFPVLPPSTTNRSSWKNWLTTVCLCNANQVSMPSQRPGAYPLRCLIHPASSFVRHHPRTFNTCNSFNPCCVNSCIRRASLSVLCSRNASLVRRFAYSLKLYAANCLDWRRRERYSDRTSTAVVLAIPVELCEDGSFRGYSWVWRNQWRTDDAADKIHHGGGCFRAEAEGQDLTCTRRDRLHPRNLFISIHSPFI
jgi:hypothetical protein